MNISIPSSHHPQKPSPALAIPLQIYSAITKTSQADPWVAALNHSDSFCLIDGYPQALMVKRSEKRQFLSIFRGEAQIFDGRRMSKSTNEVFSRYSAWWAHAGAFHMGPERNVGKGNFRCNGDE